MKIETATLSDSMSILELQKLAFRQRGVEYNNMNLKPLVESPEEYAKTFPEYTCIKATIGSTLVGAVRANMQKESCCIARLIVHPEYQGQGIGSKLLLHIEKQFRQSARRFELFTGETNEKSISLYQNLGYRVFARSDDYEVPIVYLEKKVIEEDDFEIHVADLSNDAHQAAIHKLVKEYFEWGNSISIENHGFDFDIQTMFTDFVNELSKYTHPNGILKLIEHNRTCIGVGGFKRMNDTTCELKRMYVQPPYRGNHLGTRLLNSLIRDAKEYGYSEMKLESARFMINGYALYSAHGFKEIKIYNEAESPKEYQSIIYCMSKNLDSDSDS